MSLTRIETTGTFNPSNYPLAHTASSHAILHYLLSTGFNARKKPVRTQDTSHYQYTNIPFDRNQEAERIYSAYTQTNYVPQNNSLICRTVCLSHGDLFHMVEIVNVIEPNDTKGTKASNYVIITPTDAQNDDIINELLPKRLGHNISTFGGISVVVFKGNDGKTHDRFIDRESRIRDYNQKQKYFDYDIVLDKDDKSPPFNLPQVIFGSSITSVQYPHLAIWQGNNINVNNIHYGQFPISSGIKQS